MVGVQAARVVAVLTRAPSSGGKSRLFAALGCAPDPDLLTALLLDTIDGAAAPGARRVVAVTPAWAREEIAAIVPPGVEVIAQPEGDLGERMRATMASLLDEGATAVALVGSDLPELTPALLTDAFAALARDPLALVLGPAADGGYYLVAATHVPDVFAGIEWGTAGVLAQTLDAAEAAGQPVILLDSLEDVDTLDDLRRVRRSGPASRTGRWVGRAFLDSRDGGI